VSTERQTGLATVVLVSGEGTNLQALIDAERAGRIRTELRAVVSDRADARALQRAEAAGIAAHHKGAQGYAGRADYDQALAEELARYEPELLVLAGFTRILSAGFVSLFGGRMLNIHPSLLPKFRGLDTHRRVLEAGDDFHGATVHFVTEALDAGPRVLQYRIPVRRGDDEASLSARVHRGEYIILPRAVGWYADGRLRLEKGNVMLDGQELTHPVVVEEEQ
jgi:phosphoribosylglycinamide formyltransferase-1